MEFVKYCQTFEGGSFPYENVNHFCLASFSHLTSSYDVFVRMHSHGDNVLFVEVEETLSVFGALMHHSKSCGGEDEFVSTDEFEVAPCIEATETMSVL